MDDGTIRQWGRKKNDFDTMERAAKAELDMAHIKNYDKTGSPS